MSADILLEYRADVLVVTLNRPERANALGPEMVESLLDALTVAQQGATRACVIRGAGKNFCAGFDLGDIEALSDGDLLLRFVRIEALLQAVQHASLPILALAQRNAMGAGADLFAACWQRIVAPDGRFAMPGWQFEIALGTRRLVRLVGPDVARDMLIDSRTVDAAEAVTIGLASEIQPVENWDACIEGFAQRVSKLTPLAVREMAGLTRTDTRAADMAALVATAGRSGLKARVAAYIERARARR